MKPPLGILVVHGDGSHVLRLQVPRWAVYGTLALVTAATAGMARASSRSIVLERQRAELAALRRHVEDQRGVMERFERRVAAVRGEITTWKALHAKMWKSFGPNGDVARTEAGVGGGTPIASAADRPPPRKELDLLAASVAEEGPRLRELERLVQHTGEIMHALPLRWPVRGPVNSEFGRRRSPWNGELEQHEGIDIGTPPGTPVRSPAAGTVMVAHGGGGYGNHVMLDHGNGVRSRYGHLRKLDVKAGQRVEQGQVIGLVGSTGRSTGPHLHYEVLVEGAPVDPRGFLWVP